MLLHLLYMGACHMGYHCGGAQPRWPCRLQLPPINTASLPRRCVLGQRFDAELSHVKGRIMERIVDQYMGAGGQGQAGASMASGAACPALAGSSPGPTPGAGATMGSPAGGAAVRSRSGGCPFGFGGGHEPGSGAAADAPMLAVLQHSSVTHYAAAAASAAVAGDVAAAEGALQAAADVAAVAAGVVGTGGLMASSRLPSCHLSDTEECGPVVAALADNVVLAASMGGAAEAAAAVEEVWVSTSSGSGQGQQAATQEVPAAQQEEELAGGAAVAVPAPAEDEGLEAWRRWVERRWLLQPLHLSQAYTIVPCTDSSRCSSAAGYTTSESARHCSAHGARGLVA